MGLSAGTAPGRFQWQPPPSSSGSPRRGIAVDPRGNLYVTDTADNSVLKLVSHP
jgi:hypothetical protein